MSSRENQGNIWKGNSAFLCSSSKKITAVNSTPSADSAAAWSCLCSCRHIMPEQKNPPARIHKTITAVTVEKTFGPREIEHAVGEGNLMRRNWGQNQKTSVEPKHEADKLGLHVGKKRPQLSAWIRKKVKQPEMKLIETLFSLKRH